MISHWEVFGGTPTVPFEDRTHVTLNYKSVIFLNANIYDRLGRPEAVLLLFDKVNSVIGVNPAPPTLPNAFKVKPQSRGRHRIIHAAPFCRHYGIKIDNTTAFVNPEVDEEGILRLDLKSTTPARTVRRRKGQ